MESLPAELPQPVGEDMEQDEPAATAQSEPSGSSELEARARAFLDGIREEGGALSERTPAQLQSLEQQAWKLVSEVTDVALAERTAKGLTMTRIMVVPVGYTEVKRIVRDETGEDCEVSFGVRDPYPDGRVEVEIVWYPRDEYPLLYDLRSAHGACTHAQWEAQRRESADR